MAEAFSEEEGDSSDGGMILAVRPLTGQHPRDQYSCNATSLLGQVTTVLLISVWCYYIIPRGRWCNDDLRFGWFLHKTAEYAEYLLSMLANSIRGT